MGKLRIPLPLLPALGVLEIAATIIYLIPRTSFLGAILLTGYLGGAICTHLLAGDPWFFPIIIGVLAWLGLALRQPLIFSLSKDGQTRDGRAARPQGTPQRVLNPYNHAADGDIHS